MTRSTDRRMTVSRIELKGCPFCGGKASLMYAPVNAADEIPCWGAYCTKCHTMIGTTLYGRTDFYRTKEEAAEAWNKRAGKEKVRCCDCKYFDLDHFGNIDGMALIVAHNICTKWGRGCATTPDGFCHLGERREADDGTRP